MATTNYNISGSIRGFKIQDPFLDVASTTLPRTIKQLFKWCKYYSVSNPLVNAVINKIILYPIQKLTFENTESHPDPQIPKRYEDLFIRNLNVRLRLKELSKDYYTYGIAIASVYFPFDRYLVCPACGEKIPFDRYDPKKRVRVFAKFR